MKTIGKRLDRKRARKAARLIYGGTPIGKAMKEIGYADTTAGHRTGTLTENPIYKEESGRIRAALIRKDEKFADKVAVRLLEGLDAEETKFFAFEGEVTDERNVISWSERRQYAELITNLFGELRAKDEGKGGMVVNISQFFQLILQAEAERGL